MMVVPSRRAASWYARVWLSPLCGVGRRHTMTGHPDELLERPGRGRTWLSWNNAGSLDAIFRMPPEDHAVFASTMAKVYLDHGWTSCVGAAAAKPVEVAYVTPVEGSVSWFDTIAIPADAPHPDEAHAFIDYLMDPAVAAATTRDIGYANGNRDSWPLIPESVRNDPAVYAAPAVFATLVPARSHTQDYSRRLNRAWTRIKTGQ